MLGDCRDRVRVLCKYNWGESDLLAALKFAEARGFTNCVQELVAVLRASIDKSTTSRWRSTFRFRVFEGLTPLVGWDWWGECFYVILLSMRKLRNFSADRCYHLISRVANKAFYFTEEERGRFVERMWRVAYFTCIWLLWKEKDILKLKKGLICVIRA